MRSCFMIFSPVSVGETRGDRTHVVRHRMPVGRRPMGPSWVLPPSIALHSRASSRPSCRSVNARAYPAAARYGGCTVHDHSRLRVDRAITRRADAQTNPYSACQICRCRATGRTVAERNGCRVRRLVHLTATCIFWIGYGALRARATRLARLFFRFAYTICPGHVHALRFCAWSLRDLGDLSGAIAQYRELLRLYPSYVEGRVELGFALSDLDRYPEAIEQFEEALNHSPRDQAAQRGLAAMLLSINHSADVITACEGLLREYPADWVGWWFLARARANTRQWDDALAAYETARTLHSDPEFAADYASVLIELDRYVEAEAVVKAALAACPGDRTLRVMLACTLMGRRQYADAEALLQEVLREDPVNAHARHGLATLLADTARAAEAAAIAEGLRVDFPDDAEAHATLGLVALKAGRSQDALTAYEAALWIEPGRIGFTAGRAMALKRLG